MDRNGIEIGHFLLRNLQSLSCRMVVSFEHYICALKKHISWYWYAAFWNLNSQMNSFAHSLGVIKISIFFSGIDPCILGSKIVPVLKVISSVKVELLCLFILKQAIIVAVLLPTF